MSGLASGMDTENIIKELMAAQRTKATKIENNITKLEWKQEKWKTLNSKIYSFYTDTLSKVKMQGSFMTKKAASSNEAKVEVNANSSVPEGSHSVKVKAVASAQFITGVKPPELISSASYDTKLSALNLNPVAGASITIKAGSQSKELEIKADTTIGDVVNALQEAGLNASYDTTQQRFFISSKSSGIDNAFSITSTDTAKPVDLTRLGLSDITFTKDALNGTADVTVASGVSLIEPKDAIIIYNGAEIRSSSNSISANGLNITVKNVTSGLDNADPNDDEVINISITKDTQAVYDMIKGFVKSYNEVLKELNTSYNADTAKGYDPLTDEQKEAMSEGDIEKWENKIKDSLLRRDGVASSVISSMRAITAVKVNHEGKYYSLASFGINSVEYTEKGILHISGDKDDSLVGSKDDKLMKALTENPDAVMKVFNEFAGKLYSTMTDQMKSTPISSALTFYNDKEIKSTLEDYQDSLKSQEKRLTKLENRYYKQFTAMEKMMSQLNSQSSNLASLLGTNTGS
jgi:flagellar hook-associated protein 2